MAVDAAFGLAAEPALAYLTASRRVALAEHLRLPYELDPGADHARPRGTEGIVTARGTYLAWPATELLRRRPEMASLRLGDGTAVALCARILSDGAMRDILGPRTSSFSALGELRSPAGDHLATVWSDPAGSVVLPFEPDEVLLNYLSERYVDQLPRNGRGPVSRALLRTYYRIRGLLPRPLQIWIRRHYARLQARTPFPRWPLETGLHDFIDLFLNLLADVAGAEIPYIAPWPDGYRWALVLTHDVETEAGLRAMEPMLEIERAHGMRSSWNFVPRRYVVPDGLVAELQRDGFEVGVHGLHHDGRDLSSLAGLRARLPAIQEVAARWGAVGFRSPASHRRWEWMPLLRFDYDSSYPDTDPFEPQRGGCCSWWPFFNHDLVELPLTMPHDHTLFVILGQRDESMWIEKAQALRRRGGMALLVTHPDYMLEGPGLAAYERLVARYASDPEAWRALPAQVSAWWRRRAASSIVPTAHGWGVVGPAQTEARVALALGRGAC